MGFFGNISAIGKINTLLKQIDQKIDAIYYEARSPYPNSNRVRVEAGTIVVLMSEIADIADNAGNSVKLTHYYLKGQRLTLMEISQVLAAFIAECEKCC